MSPPLVIVAIDMNLDGPTRSNCLQFDLIATVMNVNAVFMGGGGARGWLSSNAQRPAAPTLSSTADGRQPGAVAIGGPPPGNRCSVLDSISAP